MNPNQFALFKALKKEIENKGYFVLRDVVVRCGLRGNPIRTKAFRDFTKENGLSRLNSSVWGYPGKLSKEQLAEIRHRLCKSGPSSNPPTVESIQRFVMSLDKGFSTSYLRIKFRFRHFDIVRKALKGMCESGALSVVATTRPSRGKGDSPTIYFLTSLDRSLLAGVHPGKGNTLISKFRIFLQKRRNADVPFTRQDILQAMGNNLPAFYSEISRLVKAGYLSHDAATHQYEFIK